MSSSLTELGFDVHRSTGVVPPYSAAWAVRKSSTLDVFELMEA